VAAATIARDSSRLVGRWLIRVVEKELGLMGHES
jgi:hypothetical protein